MMKFFLKSKTIIGIIVSILPALLPQFGVHFTADDGALINHVADLTVQLAGAVLAGYGRVVAKDSLSLTGR